VERRGLRRAAHVDFTHHTTHARRRRAPPPRFAPRTCTPAPSHGPNFDARSTRPSSRGEIFRPFRTPQIYMVGVGPRRALQFCNSSWFGRPRRRWPRRRRPGRRRRSVPPRTGWMRSPSHCERHDAHALSGDIRLIRTLRCVGPPRVRLRVRVLWRGDGGDCVCIRMAVVADSIDSTARSAMWSGCKCAVGTHTCTHERT
jgi:hypothetical protein